MRSAVTRTHPISQHWWLNLWGVCDAFLRMPTPPAREMFFAGLGAKLTIAKSAIYEIQAWMGDALLVNSCHSSPVLWMLIIPPDLSSLLCLRQEMVHSGVSYSPVLHSRRYVLCPQFLRGRPTEVHSLLFLSHSRHLPN